MSCVQITTTESVRVRTMSSQNMHFSLLPNMHILPSGPSVTQFLFRPETKTFIVSALIGFAAQKFIGALEEAITNTFILKGVLALDIYQPGNIEDLIDNSSLSAPRYKKVQPALQICIAALQLVLNLFIIYLVYLSLEAWTPKPQQP